MMCLIIFLFLPVDGFDHVGISLNAEVMDGSRPDMKIRNKSCGFDDLNEGWLNEQPIGKKSYLIETVLVDFLFPLEFFNNNFQNILDRDLFKYNIIENRGNILPPLVANNSSR